MLSIVLGYYVMSAVPLFLYENIWSDITLDFCFQEHYAVLFLIDISNLDLFT